MLFFRFPMWLCFCFCSFGVWICWNCGSAAEIWSWPNYHRPGRLSSWGGHWFPCDLPSPAWVHYFERLNRPCIPPPCYSNLLVSSLLPSFAQPSHNPSFIPAETSFPFSALTVCRPGLQTGFVFYFVSFFFFLSPTQIVEVTLISLV